MLPPPATVERWCLDFIQDERLDTKTRPPAPPDTGDEATWELAPPARRIERPGRPRELDVTRRSPRTPRAEALVHDESRARLVHTFLHHELQAAELFAWAVLAFPDAPRAFRRGLVRLCGEELAHLALYAGHLERLGARYGDFPVRDWFWERVPTCQSPLAFVALLGVGLEGANLEHSARFAGQFRAAGDGAGAEILERVEREEIGHVAFAVRWFRELNGGFDYEAWSRALPAPLTPAVLQGRPLNAESRMQAGLDADFLARLAAEPPTNVGREA